MINENDTTSQSTDDPESDPLQTTLEIPSLGKIMTLLRKNVYDFYKTAIMKGKARGKAKMAEDMARSLLADGFPVEFVMKHTHT